MKKIPQPNFNPHSCMKKNEIRPKYGTINESIFSDSGNILQALSENNVVREDTGCQNKSSSS